jgi:hypothetical protein
MRRFAPALDSAAVASIGDRNRLAHVVANGDPFEPAKGDRIQRAQVVTLGEPYGQHKSSDRRQNQRLYCVC